MKKVKTKILRVIALFIVVNILVDTLYPTISWALTAGPTSPEFSSFEPVDTTDMINMATGDFTYSLPLLEVPGPEGNYPLALSYHAGILPEDEASWVGLGWSLNPGAINRYLNAVPDDYNDATERVTDTWSGGETSTFSIGVGIGLDDAASIGVGFTFANDTYRGFGIGADIWGGVGVAGSKTLGVGLSAGISPYGDNSYVSAGLNGMVGQGIMGSASVGVTLSSGNDGTHVSVYGGAGINAGANHKIGANGSLLDLSMSSNSTSPSMGIAGLSVSSIDQNSKNITTISSSFSISIPIYYVILNLGFSHTRYYLNQYDQTSQFGSLYANNLPSGTNNVMFDSYAMKSPFATAPYSSDPETEAGGSVSAYDVYNVLGQGIGGTIKPYTYEVGSQVRKTQAPEPATTNSYPFQNKIAFRFTNDFSNSFVRDVSFAGSDVTQLNNTIQTLSTAKVGIAQKNYSDPSLTDFDYANGKLPGSRQVEWYTNQQISDAFTNNSSNVTGALKGFVPGTAIANRSTYFTDGIATLSVQNQIGGFMIKNPSGLSYHYSLPVYNYADYTYATATLEGTSTRSIFRPIPYAYSWLLTAVTGPDYVDRAPYGEVDDNDYGYWVRFEYGKWTSQYRWRDPNSGSNKDLESSQSSFSSGKKELYYLDAIVTRTHTALFVKDIRQDGKGVMTTISPTDFGIDNLSDDGGFGVNTTTNTDGTISVNNISGASMKLVKIMLFSNKVLNKQLETNFDITVPTSIAPLKSVSTSANDPIFRKGTSNYVMHYWENVLDVSDFNGHDISNSAMRQIVFNYSYDLCPGVTNSFDIDYSSYQISYPNNVNKGKLTLNSVQTLGYNGTTVVPPTTFTYANNPSYNHDQQDIWGMYNASGVSDPNQLKLLNATDAGAVMAWSLTGIGTSIGSHIAITYESDQYKSSLASLYNIPLSCINLLSMDNSKLRLYLNQHTTLPNISEFTVGSLIPITLGISVSSFQLDNQTGAETAVTPYIAILNDPSAEILSISPSRDYIDVRSTRIVYDIINYYDGFGFTVTDQYGTKSFVHLKDASSSITNSCNSSSSSPTINISNNLHYSYYESINLNWGNIIAPAINDKFGGGLRVKSISVTADNVTNTSNYQYAGGVTSYEPLNINIQHLTSTGNNTDYRNNIYIPYLPILSSTAFLPSPGVFYKTVTVSDQVTQTNSNNNSSLTINGLGSTVYTFDTYTSDLYPRILVNGNTGNSSYNYNYYRIANLNSRIGLLRSVVQYGPNGQPLSQTVNNYLHDSYTGSGAVDNYGNYLETYMKNQGRIEELFMDNKTHYSTFTEVEEYPVIKVSSTVTNKKLNTTSYSSTLAYDYYSGEPLAMYFKDHYGREYLTESVPAYTVYPAMGIALQSTSLNKNMLTQNAASYSYLISSSSSSSSGTGIQLLSSNANTVTTLPSTSDILSTYSKVGLLGASANVWSNVAPVMDGVFTRVDSENPNSQSNIWRQNQTYSYVGDKTKALLANGTYDLTNFASFNFASPANSLTNFWQLQQTVTLISPYSKPLETIDLNGNYSASLMDPKDLYTIASVSNAARNEVTYSGVEFDYCSPAVNPVGIIYNCNKVVNDPVRSHTGNNSLLVNTGEQGFQFNFTPQTGKKYKASVWVYLDGTDDNSTDLTNVKLVCSKQNSPSTIVAQSGRKIKYKARGFYLLELVIDPGNSTDPLHVFCQNATAARAVYFDDFRVHPLDADMVSYVYDQDKTQLLYIMNTDNLYTRYQYDDAGRVTQVFQEFFNPTEKLVKRQIYHYGGN